MNYLTLKFRVAVLVIFIVILFPVYFAFNAWQFNFYDAQLNFVFYTLLFAIVMGLLIKESKYTTPQHSLANSLTILLSLTLLKYKSEILYHKYLLVFFSALALVSILTIFVYDEGRKSLFSRILFNVSTFLGKATIAFSVVFIFSLFSFYAKSPMKFLTLLIFWAFIISSIATKMLLRLQNYFISYQKKHFIDELGKITEQKDPGLLTFTCFEGFEPERNDYCFLIRGKLQLYRIYRKILLATNEVTCKAALVLEIPIEKIDTRGGYKNNILYHVGDEEKLRELVLDGEILKQINNYIGMVVQQTNINAIRFQVISNIKLEEGYVLATCIDGKDILYQIVNVELSLDKMSEGAFTDAAIGIAQQVGEWNSKKIRFEKFGWIPNLYSPLYLVDKKYDVSYTLKENELILGNIPNTKFPIIANAETMVTHHTAILGITGSGKTELAFTIIQKMEECKTKIFCVDFTGDYIDEFSELNPHKISLPEEMIVTLNEKLFDAETGEFGAGKEKKALEEFKKKLIPQVEKGIKEFIDSEEKHLGILELSEISNTSASIAVTELYISSIFKVARESRGSGQKYCIVLEEAHTIIPEDRTLGVQDKFSKATISKICQIALQGRKFKVGLLVIAQRTANVTKTVLNQCNSIIIFNSFDKTGYDFMENYIGKDMVAAIPNLKNLQSVVAGRAFKSGRPLIMTIPFKDKFEDERE